MTLKAEKFEELLTTELTSSLDPQRGKALAAFRTHLATEAERPAVAGSLKDRKEISRKEMWFWSSIPSVAAACLAVVVALKLANPGAPAAGTSAPAVAGTKQIILTPFVDQARTITQQEDAIVLNKGVPQRRINEKIETTTTFQDDQAIYRLSQPEGTNVRYEQVIPF